MGSGADGRGRVPAERRSHRARRSPLSGLRQLRMGEEVASRNPGTGNRVAQVHGMDAHPLESVAPANETELDELLSRPSSADVEAMARLSGDLLVLGAGGKMGPTLVMRAKRAIQLAGGGNRVIAVARFTNRAVQQQLEDGGVETIEADLLDPEPLDRLPDAPNVIFMAARKFGTAGAEYL